MTKRYSQPILPDGSEVIFPSDTRIVEHGNQTLNQKLTELDNTNAENITKFANVENKFKEVENSINESIETSKIYTDTTKKEINENISITNENVAFNKVISTLPNFITPEFRNFVSYTPSDSSLYLQGSCVINNSTILLAYCSDDEVAEKGEIVIFDLTNNTIKKSFKDVSIWHGNDFAYDSKTNELWCCSMYSDAQKRSMVVLDYDTMEVKRTILLPFANDFIMGVALKKEYYIVSTRTMIYFVNYTDNTVIKSFSFTNDENGSQGIELYKNFIIFQGFYKIYLFSYEGELIKTYTTPKTPEFESLLKMYDDSFILTHRNYGLGNKEVSLRTFKLDNFSDNYITSEFYDIKNIGIAESTEQETMENIFACMGDKSRLIWGKTAANTASCYPAPTGTLTCVRYGRDKAYALFVEAGNTNCNMWVGNYNKNIISKPWSGWNRVATSVEDYRVIEFAGLGLTLDDFTTSLSDNIQKIINKLGSNRVFVCYPYATQSNANFYNSIKSWCGSSSDGYTVKIESSVNGNTGVATKITVNPNTADGNNIEIIGYYDNALGTPQTMVSLETVKSLIATAKTEVLATCDTKYQPKTV